MDMYFETEGVILPRKKIIQHISFAHYYKQKFTFYVHLINDIYGLYYRPHTLFNNESKILIFV